MHTITLGTDDPKILETFAWLARKLGVKIYPDINKEPLKDRERLLKIVNKGGDMSYIGDPISWQKSIRKDR
jgi:hypothetical protein